MQTHCLERVKRSSEAHSERTCEAPMSEYGFEGLRPGDSWCLCAARWLEAYKDKSAPRVHLMRTHQRALEVVPFELLKALAVDLN
ncbi:MAG TPA: hypothetical protein DD827_00890 [Gammaproteobacteria bacterium]|nr:hypothetical protein [Gammaproteobacteria bacterium]